MMAQEFDPRTQRLSYKFSPPKPYKLPRLTEMQLAVLACVRDDMVRVQKNYRFGYHIVMYTVLKRFDVTNQIRSLRKRRLIKYPTRDSRHDAHFSLTAWGLAELAEHPEF